MLMLLMGLGCSKYKYNTTVKQSPLQVSQKQLIVSSNSNNDVHTRLFYFNANNTVSNANANNGSQLLPIGFNFYNNCVIFVLPHPLVENKDWPSKCSR